MSDDAKTWLCRWCTFEGLTRDHIVAHELYAHPKFYSARETAGCGCGPNQACLRCLKPRPVSVFVGQQYMDDSAPASPYATTAEDAAKAAARRITDGPPPCTCDRRPGEYRHASTCRLLAWMRTAEQGIREASRPVVGLDALLPQCAHQWLLLDGKGWCPNCDEVRAPGERKR